MDGICETNLRLLLILCHLQSYLLSSTSSFLSLLSVSYLHHRLVGRTVPRRAAAAFPRWGGVSVFYTSPELGLTKQWCPSVPQNSPFNLVPLECACQALCRELFFTLFQILRFSELLSYFKSTTRGSSDVLYYHT